MSEVDHSKIRELEHRNFRNDDFWKEIPAWADVSRGEFADHKWQLKNSIRKVEQVEKVLGSKISKEHMDDIKAGQKITPMNIRITPYIFALIDWRDPLSCPLRKQFLPMGSQFLEDHPYYQSDSLGEDVDSPVPMLTHRYPDKVLFLPTTICPVYCSYCTRSRIIGGSTESIEKETYGANQKKWDDVFEYLSNHPKVEDVVVSGGDAFMLTPKQIRYIGENLLRIPHIRRIRLATKGVAIFPQKVLTDDDWFEAVQDIHKLGRSFGKQVVIHTHFSCAKEITKWSQMAMDRLFQAGIVVRNQAVLQEGVNNHVDEMVLLTRQVGYLNIQPYYVYMHDMVPGCEHFRTTLKEAEELEKAVRGTTAGFNTPTFVCDLPGGGGKRHVASYEYYDEENGISVWKAPHVKPGELFTYFDPIHKLSAEAQARWKDPQKRQEMIDAAIAVVKNQE
ncbi:putative L-lysine 2,3-aminomutase [Halobacteriovorax marinus SJ]|uniref:L-lysine 2,3-aminomutase n=1 Tax=Halobacteriovorax marinus (strain ATCC BAA-682 / DSM 15412 / SJ) TaxID=862908 RepID=E1X1E8_HALMS|nr:KamA family radical SAM protein [Halobacteriovorax marinus]CBW26539.1 putative L-lysine 2,3-aminomutase [Halobacteriovorax marinus SJ]